jgi:hypothetical protein
MKPCGGNLRRKLFTLMLLVGLVAGCAGSSLLSRPAPPPAAPADVLHMYLDRADSWRSLSSMMKLKIRIDNESLVARGHLLYLLGERFEVGFTKPFNRFLGNFYVTPDQLLYWDAHAKPRVFTPRDTVALGDLIPLNLPHWDPRDVLPFPMSGRTSGFQTDSVWTVDKSTFVRGVSGNATYIFTLSGSQKILTEERLYRQGCDPLIKRFDRIHRLHGWPVAARVTCSNDSKSVRFIWSLNRISLDAEEYSTHGSTSGSDTTEPGHGG